MDDDILSRISAENTAHETWEILKHEYMGAQKVILVKLQTLRQNLETLSMEQKETVQEYLGRMSTIVNHKRCKKVILEQTHDGYGK